ncbi:MAG: ABC transporter ATP-binding protein [Epsilonproteobacteria bacterium]|nr:MAG: ABC transporter ATP-binding protein [Campylobacterota bacterium]
MLRLNINKQLKEFNLKFDINIPKGQIVAIGGDSGCGKTTALRIIAGLVSSQSEIIFENTVWQDKNQTLKPQKRHIGYIPQDSSVFPNMTVKQNLMYIKKDEKMCDKLLDMTEILNLKNRHIQELSGGQIQRVALCRAFMRKPTIMLLDEPLSNLHKDMRAKIINNIKIIHKEFKTITLFVSHNFDEIQTICDRFLVFGRGKIIKDGEVFYDNKIQAKVVDINHTTNHMKCLINKKHMNMFDINKHINIKL